MFLAHFGMAFAAKRIEPKINLGVCILASQFIDLIWPIFVLLGWESVSPLSEKMGMNVLKFDSYPFSHSLVATFFWSFLVAGVFYLVRREKRPSLVLFFLVLSHWFLDLLVHEPDLPLLDDSSIKVGFLLWRSVPITVLLELGIFFAGIWLFLTRKVRLSKGSLISFIVLIVFLLAIYASSIFGPVPPAGTSAAMLAGPALLMWLFVLWGRYLK
ncbi:hypothetical protein [Bdellovibrio sp.]|uniref:hypothetical protein n=1 Tax=Bdellovibrio sp. TaxID=28201 RepID=UPI0039E71FD6